MKRNKSIFLPALKAQMGDWTYYIAFMEMKDVAERLEPASEIHESQELSDLLQRVLDESKHAKGIAKFLKTDPQRLFNSLVVGVYGGEPKWHGLKIPRIIPDTELAIPDYIMDAHGLLELSGEESLFAIDGQHRAKGIEVAIKNAPELASEEIPLIFVGHKKTPEGMERTRRLFTRLNKYAKVVSKAETITLDEDDVCAIITRRLVENSDKFSGKVSIKNTASMPRGDKNSITTITALYDVCDQLLPLAMPHDEKWPDFKRSRPSNAKLNSAEKFIHGFWDALATSYESLREAFDADKNSETPAKYRTTKGGSLIFRPIGLTIIAKALRNIAENADQVIDLTLELDGLDMDLNSPPWRGLLWNNRAKKMITTGENQKAAADWLAWKLGADKSGINEEQLRENIANIMDINIGKLDW